jgi:hypothetical protein
LSDPRLNKDRVRIDVYHKRYMIVTKLVDLVAETLIHDIGGDLYERGGNIAMSNFLYYCMPTYCGEPMTNAFLQAFIDLIRHGPAHYKEAFYKAGSELVDASIDEGFKEDMMYFTAPALYDTWYRDFDWSALDPAIPALFHQIVVWGKRKTDRFHVLHDHSKPILATQEMFKTMMAGAGEESKTIGTDRRKITFPLRATSLSQGDSKTHPQLQVADLCAGALNHYYKCHVTDQPDDLSNAVEALGCLDWGNDGLLPQPYVTPETLGTDGPVGNNSVEEMVRYFEGRSVRR